MKVQRALDGCQGIFNKSKVLSVDKINQLREETLITAEAKFRWNKLRR